MVKIVMCICAFFLLQWRRIWVILISVIATAQSAFALNTVSLYLGSNRVETGVILSVGKQELWLLALDGQVKRLNRYEVLGIACYALPRIPIEQVSIPANAAPFYSIDTLRDGDIVHLVTGWAVAFDSDRIEFLSSEGEEVLVPRDQIWQIERLAPPRHLEFTKAKNQFSYRFRHPLAFEAYPEVSIPHDLQLREVPLVPHVTYVEPLAVKEFFDRIAVHFAVLSEYQDRQRFYARPTYFGRRTYLGTWTMLGSRYVNVGARRSNFLPSIQSQSTSGPFLFQSEILSGVLPRRWGLHAEPMPQVAMTMKDAYVAFDAFLDPTALLIGPRYQWSASDLNALDARVTERLGARLGIDWKYIGIHSGAAQALYAIRFDEHFSTAEVSIVNTFLSFAWNQTTVEIGYALGVMDLKPRLDLRALTIRLETPLPYGVDLFFRYVNRRVRGGGGSELLDFSEDSHEFAPFLMMHLDNRWRVSLLPALEYVSYQARSHSSGTNRSNAKLFPKLGAGVALFF